MRIVHHHRAIRLESGGVVRAVLDLSGALAAAGHEVVLATSDDSDAPEAWRAGEPGHPRVVRLPAPGRGGFHPKSDDAAIARAFDGADVVHVHGIWSTANMAMVRVAGSLGIPHVVSAHGMLDDWSMAQKTLKKRIYLTIHGRRLLAGAAAIHTTAEAELAQARRWFPDELGVVAPLVMDLEPFETLPGPGPAAETVDGWNEGDGPRVLFLSRIHYKKQPELLIDALAALRRDGLPVRGLIAGTGDDAYVAGLRDRIERTGAPVGLPGFVSGTPKVSLMSSCDVFVLPTSQENFGFVLFESLAAGTPVVTTRGADTWPEMEASGGALVVDGTAEAVAAAVRGLLADPDRLRTMGEAGRRWAFDHLRTDAVVRRYEHLYGHIAAGGRGAPQAESRPDEAGAPA